MKRKCYTIMALIAALALGMFAASALAAGSDKPPAPPGQGECAHGNSGKPCKDDPQPEKGKDCEEHGPKNGGVNEDHCKGTTPPPTTTEEEPPSTTTTTTTTSTTPGESTSPPSKPGTQPPTPTVEQPKPSTSPVTPTASPVTKPTLQKQLEKQAKANGAPSTPTASAADAATEGELPYTGFETWMAVVIGLGLSGAGYALRRWGTK